MMPQLYLYCQCGCKNASHITVRVHLQCWMLGFSLTVLAGQVLMFWVPMRPAETFCGLAVTLADEHLAFIVLAWKRWTQNVNAIVLLLRLPQTKCRMWNGGGVLTAAGDLPVGLIAAVVVKFSIGVVQDGPALGMLHGIAVTLVVHLAAPWQSSHHTFDTGCTVAPLGLAAPEHWPVQIVHGGAGASVTTVAAVVGVVQDWPAIRHHTQDHFSELVERQVVQRLAWKEGSSWNHKPYLRDVSPIWEDSLTDRKTRSHEEHNLESIHPLVCQDAAPTSTSFYTKCGTLVLLRQLFTLRVITHTPKYTRTLREPTWT